MNSTSAHPFTATSPAVQRLETASLWLLRILTYSLVAFMLWILGDIAIKGSAHLFRSTPPFLNTSFLTESPETLHVVTTRTGETLEMGAREYRVWLRENGAAAISDQKTFAHSAGGILPAIVGTVLLVLGSMTIAMFFGITSAIYLSEYSAQNRFLRIIRLGILNLAGVPSIVFGMFGYGLFVVTFGWNTSLLSGWFTLAFMVLPIIITASEEALRSVPRGFREGSLALGATESQTLFTNVLPYALPGILTSSILGIARVAGETAPIMFTAAMAFQTRLPWQVPSFMEVIFNSVAALPYHIFLLSEKLPSSDYVSRVQYASALVFLLIVLSIALISILARMKLRKLYRW